MCLEQKHNKIKSHTVSTKVPEDLVQQCQGVLQGKPRTMIIRELQRTVSTELAEGPLTSLSFKI